MTTLTSSPVHIKTSAESVPSVLAWFGEITWLTHYLTCQKILERINEQVRFVRCQFGHYDVIDFVVVLLGYAISGEHTLEAFYESVQPFAGYCQLVGGNISILLSWREERE